MGIITYGGVNERILRLYLWKTNGILGTRTLFFTRTYSSYCTVKRVSTRTWFNWLLKGFCCSTVVVVLLLSTYERRKREFYPDRRNGGVSHCSSLLAASNKNATHARGRWSFPASRTLPSIARKNAACLLQDPLILDMIWSLNATHREKMELIFITVLTSRKAKLYRDT